MSNFFENYKDVLTNIFDTKDNGWVIRRNVSPLNIENCNGEARKDDETNTCEICVALNETIFRNTNKPDYYHPHCKCKDEKVNLHDVKLDFPMKKLTHYLFVDENKSAMMKSMGFYPQNAEKLYEIISENVKQHFLTNKYFLKTLDNHGQRICVYYTILGLNDNTGQIFNCHSACVVWPNGKLRISTPFIKD